MKRFLTLALATLVLTLPSCQTEKPTDKAPDGTKPVVEIKTTMGDIKVELFPDEAPITVKNFLGYVDEKFYDGTLIHRVRPGFVIQGGGFEPGMKQKRTRDPIKNEAGNNLPNLRGTIAMARTSDPDSATSQFYINVDTNSDLDRVNDPNRVGYCVFGRVTEGMDVADKISRVPAVFMGREKSLPEKDVVILSIRRVETPTSKPSN